MMRESSIVSRRGVVGGLAAVSLCPSLSLRAGADEGARIDVSPRQAPGFPDWSDQKWSHLSEPEWKQRLSKFAYKILRKEGTERAFSSALNDEKRKGWYACAGCGLVLFSSAMKYDSGTGWPSFWQPIEGRYGTSTDFKLIYPRKEYHCVRCGGHQGHVFRDGPPPTGKRWCNNGVALVFFEDKAHA